MRLTKTQRGRAKARKKIRENIKNRKPLNRAKSRQHLQKALKFDKNILKFYIKQKACQETRQACFFGALKIVAKLPLFFMKKSFIVVYERQVSSIGNGTESFGKGEFYALLTEAENEGEMCCCNCDFVINHSPS